MDTEKALQLLQAPWVPTVYFQDNLQELLLISESEAQAVIEGINEGQPQAIWVTHHDLINFVKDAVSIVEVSKEYTKAPQPAWLLSRGWRLNPSRSTYKWYYPERPEVLYSLRGALKIELETTFQVPINNRSEAPSQPEEDLLDVEFEVEAKK